MLLCDDGGLETDVDDKRETFGKDVEKVMRSEKQLGPRLLSYLEEPNRFNQGNTFIFKVT